MYSHLTIREQKDLEVKRGIVALLFKLRDKNLRYANLEGCCLLNNRPCKKLTCSIDHTNLHLGEISRVCVGRASISNLFG